MSENILRQNVALMRHAHFSMGEITTRGRGVCIDNTTKLADRLNGKKIIIFHSPATRAKITAEIVHEVMYDLGFIVDLPQPLEWLDCGCYKITNNNINNHTGDYDDTFAIFISHLPDIEHFLGIGEVKNSSIHSRDFTIE